MNCQDSTLVYRAQGKRRGPRRSWSAATSRRLSGTVIGWGSPTPVSGRRFSTAIAVPTGVLTSVTIPGPILWAKGTTGARTAFRSACRLWRRRSSGLNLRDDGGWRVCSSPRQRYNAGRDCEAVLSHCFLPPSCLSGSHARQDAPSSDHHFRAHRESGYLLQEVDGSREFPILIGIFEATNIDRRVKDDYEPQRPLTHDLVVGVAQFARSDGGERDHQ